MSIEWQKGAFINGAAEEIWVEIRLFGSENLAQIIEDKIILLDRIQTQRNSRGLSKWKAQTNLDQSSRLGAPNFDPVIKLNTICYYIIE